MSFYKFYMKLDVSISKSKFLEIKIDQNVKKIQNQQF